MSIKMMHMMDCHATLIRKEEEDDDEEEEEEEEEGGGSEAPAREASSVALVTADFAMQNVALQMGLTLVAPDGLRISSLRRWVLRCHACTAVTPQMERHFCDRCGNAARRAARPTRLRHPRSQGPRARLAWLSADPPSPPLPPAQALQRVAITVDASGVEHAGVRRRHRLRGTRYSLPAPKGGRYAVNPILREDQLSMMRAPSKGNKKGGGGEAEDELPEAVFERAGNAPPLTNAGRAPVVGRMRNPNERVNKMLNRRR